MEIVIQILILFIIINSILKLSFWRWWQVVIFGAIGAIFVLWAQQYAITQSKTQLQDYFQNRRAMQDMAVLITVESAIGLGFCFAALMNGFGKRKKSWLRFLHGYPGLLLFPVLFYLLTQTIFSLSGTDFTTIAYAIAGTTFLVIPLAVSGIKWLIPEKELRLEVHFLVSLFVAILGLLTTVNGNVTYAAVREPLNIKGVLFSALLFVLFFTMGFLWSKYKWRFRKKYAGWKQRKTQVQGTEPIKPG